MQNYEWESEIRQWMNRQRSLLPTLTDNIVHFFGTVFTHTAYPDRSWFGVHGSVINVVVGNIWLAAINLSPQDNGIWLLVDRLPSPVDGWSFVPVRSSEHSATSLYWGHSGQWDYITQLENEENRTLWEYYANASRDVFSFSKASSDRDLVQIRRGKIRLSDFWEIEPPPLPTPEPSTTSDSFGEFESEMDFEDQIIVPLLDFWGFSHERQYDCRIVLGARTYSGKVDFRVFDDSGTLTIVENKLSIGDDTDLSFAREQTKSYAQFEGLNSFVVAAPQGIWVYSLHRGKATLERYYAPSEVVEDAAPLKEHILSLR